MEQDPSGNLSPVQEEEEVNSPHHDPNADLPHHEDEEGGPVKSFLEHLEDLRWVIIRAAAALVVAMIVCLVAANQVIAIMKYPLIKSGTGIKLEWLGPMGGFMASLKMGFWGGMVLSMPFILYVVGQFILPALKKKEKKYFLRAFIIGTGFFMLGLVICYFYLLPFSLVAFVKYNSWLGIDSTIWRAEEYFDMVSKFLIGVGLLFEMPVVVLSLVRLGVIGHATLVKGRRYMFVVNLAFTMVITPADLVTTFIMACVLQLAFEVCIMISGYWEKQRAKAEAANRRD